MRYGHCVLGVVIALLVSVAGAEVRLPGIFADNMVLQREMPVPIWGWASPDEKVTVQFAGQEATATANASGKWRVTLPALKASKEPAQLTVSGAANTRVFQNVLVGEVWIASGQSNMQWNVANSNNASQEIPDADNYPQIRLCSVERVVAPKPLEDTTVTWAVCSRETIPYFSAVAYFFGKDLSRNLDVPIGLIHASWGGTPAQAWVSIPALEKLPFMEGMFKYWQEQLAQFDYEKANAEFEKKLAEWKKQSEIARSEGKNPGPKPTLDTPDQSPHQPGVLFNGMIAPICPYAIRGAIWYQGESDAGRWFQYRDLMTTLIYDWREKWNEGDFPFLYVQLANYMAEQTQPCQEDATWPLLRESQWLTLSVAKTGMATAIDVGEANDIHPRDKQTVGNRLALVARAITYGQDVVYSGPSFKAMKVSGNEVIISYDHIGGGLKVKGDPLRGFALAGEDGLWYWAQARLEGDTVVLSADEVDQPISACYAWANNPIGNLYNAEGLPALPFRVDSSVQVRSNPFWPGEPATIFVHTGSSDPIALTATIDEDRGTIQPDKMVVSQGRSAELTFSSSEAQQPVKFSLTRENGRTKEYWMRPGRITIPRVAGIQLDGDLSDWPGQMAMDAHYFETGSPQFKPEMQLAWSPEGLFVGGRMEVENMPTPTNPQEFWQWTCIELFIDPANSSAIGWGDTSHQFWFCPVQDEQEQWRLYAGEFKRNSSIQETLYDDSRVKTAINVYKDVVMFEMFFPAEVLKTTLAAGNQWRIGIALQKTDADPSKTSLTKFEAAWPRLKSNGLLDGTRQWGEATLENTVE